jgi:hypothetical protein
MFIGDPCDCFIVILFHFRNSLPSDAGPTDWCGSISPIASYKIELAWNRKKQSAIHWLYHYDLGFTKYSDHQDG